MSESTPQDDASTEPSSSDSSAPPDAGTSGGSAEGAGGAITDDQLPDDLNPEKNVLAREPDEDEDTGASVGPAEGGAGLGQPG